jgi:hypothetical protein
VSAGCGAVKAEADGGTPGGSVADGLGVGPGWGSVLGPLLGGDGGELPDDVADPIRSLNPIRLAEQSFRVEIVD